MEGLISTIVVLYLVASMVGAVLKRLQQGPILDEPAMPTDQAERGEQQVRPAQKTAGKPREVVVIGIPPFPSEMQQPITGERALREVQPRSDELAPEAAEVSSLDPAVEQQVTAIESLGPSAIDEGLDREEDSYALHRMKQPSERQAAAGKARSPYRVATASEWRKAVILAEVLNKPRALRPYRPMGMR